MTWQRVEAYVRRHERLRQTVRSCRARFPRTAAAVRRGFRPTWRRRTIRRYFAEHPVAKVQIGTGTNVLAGWLNTDLEPVSPGVIFLNAAKPLPFADRSVDYLFSEHMIEHVPYAQGLAFLRECRRVLKPGGRVRIATPNLLNLVHAYHEPWSQAAYRYLTSAQYESLPGFPSRPCAVVNYFVRSWGHQFIYDPETLTVAMESAGLTVVRFCPVGESADPSLQRLESHGQHIGDWNNRFETMVLEAIRPTSAVVAAADQGVAAARS